MQAIPDEGMDAFIRNAVVFTGLIRTEEAFCGSFLFWTSPAFALAPGNRNHRLGTGAFPMIIHAKGAIPFTFGFHHARFAWLGRCFLFLEKAADPRTAEKAIEFKR